MGAPGGEEKWPPAPPAAQLSRCASCRVKLLLYDTLQASCKERIQRLEEDRQSLDINW